MADIEVIKDVILYIYIKITTYLDYTIQIFHNSSNQQKLINMADIEVNKDVPQFDSV